jgi:hypothetical protein
MLSFVYSHLVLQIVSLHVLTDADLRKKDRTIEIIKHAISISGRDEYVIAPNHAPATSLEKYADYSYAMLKIIQ